jgi:predicted nucleic acid binding AN1-type Zn finger protein
MSKYPGYCEGKVKLSKKDIQKGITDDSCHMIAKYFCEHCGKSFCGKHIDREKHDCNYSNDNG